MSKLIVAVTNFFLDDFVGSSGAAHAHGLSLAQNDTLAAIGIIRNVDDVGCVVNSIATTNQTWTQRASQSGGAGGGIGRVNVFGYRTIVGSSPGSTVTINYSKPDFNRCKFLLVQMRDMDSSNPDDQAGTAVAGGNSDALTIVCSAQNTLASGFAFSAIASDDGAADCLLAAPTGVGSWTQLGVHNDGGATPFSGFEVASRSYSALETTQAQYTGIEANTNQGLIGIVFTFKEAVSQPQFFQYQPRFNPLLRR